MQLKQKVTHIIPPCPKTNRGQTSFLQSSPTHLLYFNGCTVILRPHENSSVLFINHNCLVTAVKFSYGYKFIASIDQKGTLMIHEVQPDKLVIFKNYQGFFIGGRSIDWTSDNKRICVVGSGKNKFGRVVSVQTGTDIGQVGAVTANLTTVSFRPEKPYKLAVGGEQFIIKFYQGPPYKFISTKKSHTNYINQIKYSPDGKLIVSVGTDRKIVLYDGLTCQIIKQLDNAHAGGIMGVAWINNQTFVTGSSDKKLKKWNISLEVIAQLDSTQDKNQLALIDSFIVAVTYCPQKSSLYFVVLSGQIRQTDQNLSKITNKYQGYRNKPVKIVPISQQKDSAILFDSGGKILKINTNNNIIHRYMNNILCHNKLFADGCVSSTGIAYYLTGDQQVQAVDLNKQISMQHVKLEGVKFITNINNNKINGFVCYFSNSIKVYQQKQGEFQKVGQSKLNHEPTYVYNNLQFGLTQSDLLWVGSLKGFVQVFRLNYSSGQMKLEKLTQLQTNNSKITCIKTYQHLIFTGDSMGSIKVWKWSNQNKNIQKVSDAMGSHTSMITSILIQNDHIYTCSMDNKLSIWKLQNFTRITTFIDVHKHGILFAEIIGQKIVSCGGDLLIKVHEY